MSELAHYHLKMNRIEKEIIQELAQREKRSFNQMVCYIISKYLEEVEQNAAA